MTTQTDIPRDQPLRLDAAADLEWSEIAAAAAGGNAAEKLPSFKMTAYRGGAMRVSGWYRPVVVDLAGVKVAAKQIPIFRGHDPNRIIGHGEVTVSATEITATGLISAENEHSRDVVASSRRGFPWQASIGAEPLEIESVKEGTKTTVNGKSIAGPVLVVRKSILGEISFVPLGADRSTSAKVAAETDRGGAAKSITITAAGNKTGLWIEGSGTAFVPVRDLQRYLRELSAR